MRAQNHGRESGGRSDGRGRRCVQGWWLSSGGDPAKPSTSESGPTDADCWLGGAVRVVCTSAAGVSRATGAAGGNGRGRVLGWVGDEEETSTAGGRRGERLREPRLALLSYLTSAFPRSNGVRSPLSPGRDAGFGRAATPVPCSSAYCSEKKESIGYVVTCARILFSCRLPW